VDVELMIDPALRGYIRSVAPDNRLALSELRAADIQAQIQIGLVKACAIVDQLPTLPSVIRYYDENINERVVIRNLEDTERVELSGRHVSFNGNDSYIRILKHYFYYNIRRNAPRTAISYIDNMNSLERKVPGLLFAFIGMPPANSRLIWNTILYPAFSSYQNGNATRTFLHFVAESNLGDWNPSFSDFIAKLSVPTFDSYKTVRDQTAFVPLEDQRKIVRYIDACSANIRCGEAVPYKRLWQMTCLICSFCYGVRPAQLKRMRFDDVILTNYGQVRVRYAWAKQRAGNRERWKTWKIKDDWGPLVEQCARERALRPVGNTGRRSLFFDEANDTSDIGRAISNASISACGAGHTATDFRHTVAQRMADSGYALDQIANALCHSDYRTPLVYIENAASEGEMVNKALGLSSVYRGVIEVARNKTIDKAKLMRLPADNQVGAMPHGMPLPGIGACNMGQSLCQKNPGLSCYQCDKFIAIADPKVHGEVAEALRPIVLDFRQSGLGDTANPAFTQLENTISSAMAWAEHLEPQSVPGTSEEESALDFRFASLALEVTDPVIDE
jgi:integrase